VTLAGLLEIVLYHQDACEVAEDAMLDLADYCCRKITFLVSKQQRGVSLYEETELSSTADSSLTGRQELKRQNKQIRFQVAIKAVSILKYIIDHLSRWDLVDLVYSVHLSVYNCCMAMYTTKCILSCLLFSSLPLSVMTCLLNTNGFCLLDYAYSL
jgi:hypothetical protein